MRRPLFSSKRRPIGAAETFSWPMRRWRRRRRGAARLGWEALEPRQVLAADPILDAAQTEALLRGIQVFAVQMQAVQESAVLGEPAVALGQPLGTLIHVGDEFRSGLATPLAPLLAGPKTAAEVVTALRAAAGADDETGNAFSFSHVESRSVSTDGRDVLWFDLDVAITKPLPRYQLDLGQREYKTAGNESLLEQGLRLGTIEADVTAAVAGRVSFGVDLAAGGDPTSSLLIKLDDLAVSATARHTTLDGTAIQDVEAAYGVLRLGPAAIDVELDIAAEIRLAGSTVSVGELLAADAGALVSSHEAAGDGLSLSIPFTLGVGGFAETGSPIKIGVTAADLFHTADALPALTIVPPTLTPTAGGAFDFSQLGDIDSSALSAYLVELERLAPELIRDFRLPLVDRPAGEVFDIARQIATVFETLSGDGGLPRFETIDELIELLRDALAGTPTAPDIADFALAWNPLAQGLEFTLPLDVTGSVTETFDAAAILPAGVPLDVAGKGMATFGLAGGFRITGGVLASTSSSLPAGADGPAYEDRLYFRPGTAADLEFTLDASLTAGAALGPLSVQVYDGEANATATVVATLPEAAAGADGLLTAAEVRAENGFAGLVEIAVATPAAKGVFQLKPTPEALASSFEIGTYVADPLATYAPDPDPDAPAGTPASPVTETVPYFFLAPAAAAATAWEFTLEPSVKLQQMLDGLGDLSMDDLPGMFELFIDQLEGFDFWDVDLGPLGVSLADIFAFRDILLNFPDFDIGGLLGLPEFGDGDGSSVTWPDVSFGSFGLDWLGKFEIALPLLSLPDVRLALPDGLLFRLESLSRDLGALLGEWEGWTLGDLSLDLDFVGRLRSWSGSASLAFGELFDLDLPELDLTLPQLSDLRLSLQSLTGFLDGLSFKIGGVDIDFGLAGFGDLFVGVFNLAFPDADFPGLDLSVTPVTGSLDGSLDGKLLFDFEITVAYDHKIDFESIDMGVDGAPIPLALDGQGGLHLALDGSFATRLGFDLDTAAPLVDLDKTEVMITAGIESTTPATPGFILAATIGGLSAISIGGDESGQERATLTLSDPLDADPGDGLAPAVFGYGLQPDPDNPGTEIREPYARAAFDATLPLYVAGMADLGRITLAGFLDTGATPPFDVTARYEGTDSYGSLADILADAVFNPGVWFDLICGFTTDLTNSLAADYLAKLPFLGGIDFHEANGDPKFTFFKDICAALKGVDVQSPESFIDDLQTAFDSKFDEFRCTGGFRDEQGNELQPVDEDGRPKPLENWDWSDLGPTGSVVLDLALSGTSTITIGAGDLDIGLDALGVEARVGANLDLSFALDIGLGFSMARGLFVEARDAADTAELALGAELSLTAGSGFSVGLGPITFAATDVRNDPELTATLPLDIGTGRRFYAENLPTLVTNATVLTTGVAGVQANLAFDLSADVFAENVGFGATLALGYANDGVADGGPIAFSELVTSGGLDPDNLYFTLTDVGINLGGLLSGPVLQLMTKISEALEPVLPILDLLTAEVPLVSQVNKKFGSPPAPVTFLDLVRAWDDVNGTTYAATADKFLATVTAIKNFKTSLDGITSQSRLLLGSLIAKPDALASLTSGMPVTAAAFDNPNPPADPDAAGDEAATTSEPDSPESRRSELENVGVAFPILDGTVESIFGLLFGRDVDLVTWDVPDLTNVGFKYTSPPFPIFPPLFVKLFGSVEFGTNIDVGYDTRGIRQALADDTVRLARVANGFYFRDTVDGTSGTSDRAEVTLSATIGAAAELDVVVAAAGVSGELTGTLGANLRDPNGDGKVHFDEFKRLAAQSPECVFDFEGALDVSLDAYLKLGFDTFFGFVTLFRESLNLLDERLFSWSEISCPPADPELAEVVPNVRDIDSAVTVSGFAATDSVRALVLNMGDRAGRVLAGIEDGDEEFTIEQAVDERGAAIEGRITVKAYDSEKSFDTSEFDVIYFNSGKGADVVTFTFTAEDITTPVWGRGGSDNDQLTGGSTVNTLFGDAGTDKLVGGTAGDFLYGGDDGDFLYGMGGIDTLAGDAGDDQIYGDDDGGTGPDAAQDFIEGGAGVDTIRAGNGDDRVWGGDGDDSVFGGAGADRIAGDAGNDQLLGEEGDDLIYGDDDGNSMTEGAFDVNADRIEGGAGVNYIFGGPGFDRIWAHSEELGAAAPAAATGTLASSIIYGGDHSDTIYATAGRDYIDGGFESDEIYTGDGADYVTGGPGSDLIESGDGAAEIFGGYGNDVIVGRGGDDWIEGGPGDDEIYAGLGSDTVYGGTTGRGFPLIRAEESGPRPIQTAIHGGFATRPKNGTGESPCEPEISEHKEVYPDAPYVISVTIYEDSNGNGRRDPGEPDAESTSGWSAMLSAAGQPPYTPSVPGGTSSLPGQGGLVAGEWTVTIDGDYTGYENGSLTTTILLDEEHPTGSISLGVWRLATVSGTITNLTEAPGQPEPAVPVFVDLDGSGDWNEDEPVVQSDFEGNYEITGLPPSPDAYRVLPVLSPERGVATPRQRDVVLRSGAVADCDFEIRLANAPVVTALLVGEQAGGDNGATAWTVVPDGPRTNTPLVPTFGFRRFAFEVGGPVGLGVVQPDAVVVARLVAGADPMPLTLRPLGTPSDPRRVEYEVEGKGPLLPGTYGVFIDGAKVTGSNGSELDAEIFSFLSFGQSSFGQFPSGDGVAGGGLIFSFVVGEAVASAAALRVADDDGIVAAANVGGTIEGTVWQHDPRDSDQGRTGSERLLAGQIVELYRREGTSDVFAGTAVTGADGSFRFTNLEPAEYTVRQRPQGPWVQATTGGVSRPEQLYAASRSVSLNGITSGVKSYLTRIDVDPLAVTVEASSLAFSARDIAVTDPETAYVVGTSLIPNGTPIGRSGLWRYSFATQSFEDLGPTPGQPLLGLDALPDGRLLAVDAHGRLLTYTPAIRLWEDLGRMQLPTGQFVDPVGDIAVGPAGTAYVVGLVFTPSPLVGGEQGGQVAVGDNAGAGEQFVFEVFLAGRGANTRAIGPYVVKANPLEKDPEYLVGLEYSSGAPLVALSHRGNLFSGLNHLGDLGNPRNFSTTLGGLGLAPFGVVPDSTRDDFVIGITGDEQATVGFGNEPTGRELLDGDDFIDGGCEDKRDELYGDDGTDLPRGVVSVGGEDELRGRGGDDLLDGGLEGDVILGGDGNDTIMGGRTGLNRLEGNAGTDRIDGGAGTDFAYGHDGEDTIRGFAGGDLLFGGADPDDLDGGDDADVLVPGSGGDVKGDKAAGGAGNDLIVVIDVTRGGEFAIVPTGMAQDLYDGGAGTDTLLLDADLASVALNDTTLLAYRFDDAVGFEIAILAGGASDNVILAGTFSGRTVIRGRGGNDTLVGGTGADWIDGGDGNDSLTGTAGDDELHGGTGTNELTGGADDDAYVLAATGTNTIVEAAGGGTDSLDMSAVGTGRLFARIGSAADGTSIATLGTTLVATFANDGIEAVLLGGGDDEIVLRNGAASVAAIDAAAGSDTLAYTDPRGLWGVWVAGVTVNLKDGTATGLAGIDGVENVIGGSGGDSLSGDDVANRLHGEAGIDALFGHGGDDDLHGGADDDILVGNAGRDTLQGGGGTNALTGNEDDDVYRFSEDGHVDTVGELAGQGFDQLLFTTGTRGITFDVGARIVADDGVGRVTVLLAAGIDRVVGTTLTDIFRIADGAIFPGTLVGGGIPGADFTDLDVLDYSVWMTGVTVDYTGALEATFVGAATGTGGVVDLRHVIGGTRDDRLVAGGLPVWFEGGDGADRLEGSGQDDRLDGGAGADTLLGGFGADRLAGGAGVDTLRGGANDDRYLFADVFGVDTVHESPLEGRDTMDFSSVTVPLVVRLGSVTVTTGAGDLAIHAGMAIEEVVGGSAADAFEMTGPAVTFPGTLDGGGGVNSLTYFEATPETIAAVAAGGTPNVEAARNFAMIQAVNNEFTPVFGGGFTGAIDENAPATTVAYTAMATDDDLAPGNAITYSLVGGLGDDADLVTIDPVTGQVRLKAPANYEAKTAYFFRVMATDAGTPARSVTRDVRVNVLNAVEPRTAPRVTVPSGFRVTEDTPGPLVFNGTPFTDADSPAITIMTVTLRIPDGSLAAANGGRVVVGGSPTERTFRGTIADLNAFFTAAPARITYTPPANGSGSRQLRVTISEPAGSQPLTSTALVPVTITPADDPPVLKVPRAFTVTEDTPGNLVWRNLAVVSDRDSAAVTVRLAVDAGTITAASTRSVAVGGTPSARTFRGSPGAVSAYFASLGRIRFTAPRDDTADRTLSLEADDGVNVVSASRTITVTPVNDAPKLAAAVLFAGGLRNTPFEITHEMLGTGAAAIDVDSPRLAFRIESVSSGSLQRWTGQNWVNLVINANTPAAKRLVNPGQKIRWLPPAGATGEVAAFTIRAWDGSLASAGRAVVAVNLAAAPEL